MPASQTADVVLDREYLLTRAKILEIAAALDRIDRAAGETTDGRLEQLRQGVTLLLSDNPDRAERVQQHFSLPYNEQWQTDFGVGNH